MVISIVFIAIPILQINIGGFMKKYLLVLFLFVQSLFSQWTQQGGPFGGSIETMISGNTTLVAAVSRAGIFYSTDGGQNWKLAGSDQPFPYVQTLYKSSTGLYAGDSYTSIFQSTDDGKNWSYITKAPRENYGGVKAIYENGTSLFAAIYDSLYVTTDKGTTWKPVNTGMPSGTSIYTLFKSGTTLYAGTNAGVFISQNDGTVWSEANTGIPTGNRTTFAFTEKGSAILAGIGGSSMSSGGAVFSSTNNGGQWTQLFIPNSFGYIRSLAVKDTFLFSVWSAGAGMFSIGRISDHGQFWSDITPSGYLASANASMRSILVSGSKLVVGGGISCYASTDNGGTWNLSTNGMSGISVMSLFFNNNKFYCGTYWGYGGIFSSSNNMTSWSMIINQDLNAASTVGGFVTSGTSIIAVSDWYPWRSTDDGVTWTQIKQGITNGHCYRIVKSGTNLFIGGTDGIYKSIDNGATWSAVNNGLPTSRYVSALEISGTSIVAALSSTIYYSTDGGTNWTSAGSVGSSSPNVTSLFASGTNLFAGTMDGIFFSTNSGRNWSNVSNGIATKTTTSTFIQDGTKLIAGTDKGIFLTTNNGQNWYYVNRNGISAPITINAFMINGTSLYAGTSAGIWRRPLSEIVTQAGETSTLFPKEYFLGQNYPNPFNPTTTIRYALPSSAHVKLTLHDILGREIATLVNEEQSAGWKEVQWNASSVSSGIYFYKLSVGSFVETKKMMMVK